MQEPKQTDKSNSVGYRVFNLPALLAVIAITWFLDVHCGMNGFAFAIALVVVFGIQFTILGVAMAIKRRRSG